MHQLIGSNRTKCTCQGQEILQNNSQTCSKAKQWFLKYYTEKDLLELQKEYYDLLLKINPDEKELN